MMKTFFSAVGLVTVFIITVLSYYGLFAKVRIEEREIGNFWLVYEKQIGDYKNTGQAIDKIYSRLLGEDAIAPDRGFGLYYDNPRKVEREKLRSVVGCILDKTHEHKIEHLKKNYNIKHYPASESVVAEFPYKGTPSIFMGIFKAYPKLTDYMEQRNYARGPIMEIYDAPDEKILYVAVINIDTALFDQFLQEPRIKQ